MNQSTKTVRSKPGNTVSYVGGQASGYRKSSTRPKRRIK
jgi:hypothetical protein